MDLEDWLPAAVERCLHDLQQPTAVPFRIECSAFEVTFWESDGSGTAFTLLEADSAADAVAQVADYLQEQVFPETREAWGEARPACPGHGHPAAPTVLGGEAWWICPVTERRLSVIGAYP